MLQRLDGKTLVVAGSIAAVATYQMYEVARVTGNWKGLYLTLVHIAVVVVGVVYAVGIKDVSDTHR